jgi:hypothetical protein
MTTISAVLRLKIQVCNHWVDLEREMKKLLATVAILATVTSAQARDYTYMCKVDRQSYPVKLTTPNEGNGSLEGGTITWRGQTYEDVKLGEDCKAQFLATAKDGTPVELCTATKGYADLTIGRKRFECRQKAEERR